MPAKPAKPPHYLSNKDLLAEIIVSKAQNRLTRKAENMLILLVKRIVAKMRYQNDMDKEDVEQGALLCVLTYWRNFDAERYTNAFAYYSEIAKRGMAKSWGELKNLKGVNDYRIVGIVSVNGANEGGGIFNF